MSSSYPPPPPGPLGELDGSQAKQDEGATAPPGSYGNGPSAQSPYGNGSHHHRQASAIEAAHQGLQALQAATGMPAADMGHSPVTPQYASAMSLAPNPDMQYVQTAAGGGPLSGSSASIPKVTRIKRACDMCSQRKVKCDISGPPCRPCRELGVDCTDSREHKRRGPPNKHAQAAKAAKQPRLEMAIPVPTTPSSQTQNAAEAAEALVAIAAPEDGVPEVLDAEAIAPWDVLMQLVDDFFTYIHPLTPFPHEPTFRQSLMNREDRTDGGFLALLASIIGTLVASFPRAAREHLKSQQSSQLFPRASLMIDRCRAVALEARGTRFGSKDECNVYDAATSYFLGLSAGYTLQWNLCRRYFNESMSIIRELGYNRPRGTAMGFMGSIPYTAQPVDHIRDQMGKRIFWVMLLGVRSMAQLGASHTEIILPPPTPGEPYPELPEEVDDQYIQEQHIQRQPDGTVSLLAGFIQAIHVYMTMNPLVSIELSYGMSTLPFKDQKDMLKDCLDAVKHVTDTIPRELALNLTPEPGREAPTSGKQLSPPALGTADFFDYAPGFQYYPPAHPVKLAQDDLRRVFENDPLRKRHLQLQIQKANIYLSQLATRSFYVERYFTLRDAHQTNMQAAASNGASEPEANSDTDAAAGGAKAAATVQQPDPMCDCDAIDEAMQAERELIVQNLLSVLAALPQRSIEPNGASIINKIRQVASTLLGGPAERKSPAATEAERHLAQFVDILMRLERTGPCSGNAPGEAGGGSLNVVAGGGGAGATMTSLDEEEELRNWADFRNYQARFAARGGYMPGAASG